MKVLLTHTPQSRAQYYGERSLNGLQAIAQVKLHESNDALDAAAELLVIAAEHVLTGGHDEPADLGGRGVRAGEEKNDESQPEARVAWRHRRRYFLPAWALFGAGAVWAAAGGAAGPARSASPARYR